MLNNREKYLEAVKSESENNTYYHSSEADVKPSSVLKKFLKEPKFASGTRREEISMCGNPDGLNIPRLLSVVVSTKMEAFRLLALPKFQRRRDDLMKK